MAFTVLNECTLSPLELKGQTFTEGNGRYVLKQGQPQPQTNSQVMLLRESYKMALIALKQVPDISQYLAASFNKKNIVCRIDLIGIIVPNVKQLYILQKVNNFDV